MELAVQPVIEISETPQEVQEGLVQTYSIGHLRLLGASIRKNRGGFTSTQVRAFLDLYGEEIVDRMDKAVRDFLQEKLG